MTQRERVALVEQTLAIECSDDRCTEPISEGLDLSRRTRPECASAGQDHRPLGASQDLRARAIASAGTAGSGRSGKAGIPIGARAGQSHQVLGQKECGRAGPRPTSSLERPARGVAGYHHAGAPCRTTASPAGRSLRGRSHGNCHTRDRGHRSLPDRRARAQVTESAQHSATPVNALVAPGPAVVQTTPGRPVTRA